MSALEVVVDPIVARSVVRTPGQGAVWTSRPAGSGYSASLEAATTITGWGFYAGTPAAPFNRLVIPIVASQPPLLPTAALVRIRENNESGAIIASVIAPIWASNGNEQFVAAVFQTAVSSASPVWIEVIANGRIQPYNVTNGGVPLYPSGSFPVSRYWTDINLSSPSSGFTAVSQRCLLFRAWGDDGSTPTASLGAEFAKVLAESVLGRVGSFQPSVIESLSLGTVSSTFSATSSTFTGWGQPIGTIATPINACAVRVNAYDASAVPTKMRVVVRNMPANTALWATDNPAVWPVAAESAIIDPGLTANVAQEVSFAFNKSVSGALWVEVLSNGYFAVAQNTAGPSAPTVSAPPKVSWLNARTLSQPVAWNPITNHYTFWMRLGTANYLGGRVVPSAEFAAQIAGGGSVSSNPTVYIQLPTAAGNVIPALEGRELNMYFDNIIQTSVPLDQLCVDVVCSKGAQFEKFWRYTPTSGDAGSTTITVSVWTKDRATQLATATSTLKTVALSYPSSPVSRNVLLIGDSTLANGIVAAELVRLFSGDSKYALSLVGSNTGNVNDSGSVSRSVALDAISGWTCALFNADTATAWTQINGSARTGSPFVYSGAFNFASYLSDKGIAMSSGDWVIINLGINDVFSYLDDASANTQITAMLGILSNWITSIQSAVSGIRIGLCLTSPPCSSQDGFSVYNSGQTRLRYVRNIKLLRDAILAAYDSASVGNVIVIPYHVGLDTVNNCATVSAALNARNSATYTQQTNSVHPGASGYWQLADLLRSFLKASE